MQVVGGIATFCYGRRGRMEIYCGRENGQCPYYHGGDHYWHSDVPTYCEAIMIGDTPTIFVPVDGKWQTDFYQAGVETKLTLERLPLGCGRYMLAHKPGQVRHVEDDRVRTYPEYLTVRFEGSGKMMGLLPSGKIVEHVF